MNIIKQGDPEKAKVKGIDFTYKVYIYTCKLCGCMWEADEFDKSRNSWQGWSGVTCPNCHQNLFNEVAWKTREITVKIHPDKRWLVREGVIPISEAIIKE